MVYGVVLLLLFGATGYILLSSFGFISFSSSGGGDSISLKIGGGDSRKEIKKIEAKTSELKLINTSFFEDDRFNDLRERSTVEIDLSNIKYGKKNPFAPAKN